MKNHRVVVTRHGGTGVLKVVEEDLPEPGAGEARVKVSAAGVSAYDLMHRRSGRLPGTPKVPFTLGLDVVGSVDKTGPGVSAVEVGDRVAAGPLEDFGGYTEFICIPAGDLVPVPDGVDAAEAVCVVVDYLTADVMLHEGAGVKRGERVLIQGAAGGVGTALIELGRLDDLEMYGTASRDNHEFVSALGATPIDYQNEDFVERVRELTGDGVDVAFDPIGGARQLWRSYQALRKGGRLVWFGVAATSKHGLRVIPASLATRLFLSLIPDGRRAPMPPDVGKSDPQRRLVALLDLLRAGEIKPMVTERVPLAEAARAHEILEAGGHAGKVVLVADV
jgi:NADPH2:quinone reductase